MKVRVEIDEDVQDTEIVIRCRELDDEVKKLREMVVHTSKKATVEFFKGDCQYYFDIDEVLFFETCEKRVFAHTADDMFAVSRKLYELEEILPGQFVRISKSGIINVHHIYSIERSLTSASEVSFAKSAKRVYVSRSYYKELKKRIEERRI